MRTVQILVTEENLQKKYNKKDSNLVLRTQKQRVSFFPKSSKMSLQFQLTNFKLFLMRNVM